ncbi:Ubiquitin like protein [Spironucleus salmonicida]|uniref:Ubiquitin like protein n=1 Tax=Spironucleus salmonicida TaxID=348837 RepID=V6LSC9_9EUKA|nr:Ubiquitin like protein [Spironucleus salmonicida]|eukprot:EST47577.1 Ubiquitin-2 like Rad60 SUMO-like family and transmembrane domain-containing protein [Spironucleus salmonicida]
MIPIKLKFATKPIQFETEVSLDDKVSVLLPLLVEHIQENQTAVFLFQGRRLDHFQTFQSLKIEPNDVIQVLLPTAAPLSAPSQAAFGPFRGGYEKLLESGVERADVIRSRLGFLARTGYLSQEQLQILYLNGAILQPPRGYTAPKVQQIRAIFISVLEEVCEREGDLFVVRPLYVPQGAPTDAVYEPEFLAPVSFALMMLEAGLPERLQDEFRVADFAFVDANTPLPLTPLRALKLEVEWQSDGQNGQNLWQLARERNLEGPGNAVQPVNRVMSSFQKMLTIVCGILVGLVFNVLAFPFVLHDSMPGELRVGVFFGVISNLVFALFVGLAGIP